MLRKTILITAGDTMTTKCRVLPFDQPAGSFLLGVLSAEDVIRIKRVRRRTIDPKTMRSYGGVEREASRKANGGDCSLCRDG